MVTLAHIIGAWLIKMLASAMALRNILGHSKREKLIFQAITNSYLFAQNKTSFVVTFETFIALQRFVI